MLRVWRVVICFVLVFSSVLLTAQEKPVPKTDAGKCVLALRHSIGLQDDGWTEVEKLHRAIFRQGNPMANEGTLSRKLNITYTRREKFQVFHLQGEKNIVRFQKHAAGRHYYLANTEEEIRKNKRRNAAIVGAMLDHNGLPTPIIATVGGAFINPVVGAVIGAASMVWPAVKALAFYEKFFEPSDFHTPKWLGYSAGPLFTSHYLTSFNYPNFDDIRLVRWWEFKEEDIGRAQAVEYWSGEQSEDENDRKLNLLIVVER